MPNHLQQASSPYLLQHKDNPVDWYEWGEDALTKAREENKLILVSVGYAACHWCHVMAHESFEDQEVAKVMNKHFVNIKIDREERPDIDKVYMDAVMLMTGRGGWPLNAIALPDGRPIYGGTYFPKAHWLQVLTQLSDLWEKDPQKALDYAKNLTGAMENMDQLEKATDNSLPSRQEIEQYTGEWIESMDLEWGGRKANANKFPLPMNNLCLLRSARFLADPRVKEAVSLTLEKMALGGIYDQLGGGFARYSVDPYWKVPHFEKMLYDNGQLISLYAEAFLAEPQPLYERVVRDTIAFCERELFNGEGGYYSSLDADSEGEEGKFYVWDYEEVAGILGPNLRVFADYYNVQPGGNWEGKNVLFSLETEEAHANRWQLDSASLKKTLKSCRKQLLEARDGRVRPGLDDKILCSWNGLMLKGLCDAARVFNDSHYLALATQSASFIRKNLARKDGGLFRNFKDGKASINAFLDDYANLIEGLIALYELTFDEQWLEQANTHLNYVEEHFSDAKTGMFFYSSDQDQIVIRRKMEIQDDVIPSSNATLAHALHQLGLLVNRPQYIERAKRMLANLRETLKVSPSWHAKWAQLALKFAWPHYEVAISGPEAQSFRMSLEHPYYPNKVFAGATGDSDLPILKDRHVPGATTIYVCEGFTCQLPVDNVPEARDLIKG